MCSFASLAHHRGDVQAAVHDKYRAGNKVGGRRGQEEGQPGHIRRLAKSAQRRPAQDSARRCRASATAFG